MSYLIKGFGPGTDKHKPKKKKKTSKSDTASLEAMRELDAKWSSLPKFTNGLYVDTKAAKTKKSNFTKLSKPLQAKMIEFRSIPSLSTTDNATTVRGKQTYTDPGLAKRDAKARERKFTVAPAYNKGADQLIYNAEDYKTMGRKV